MHNIESFLLIDQSSHRRLTPVSERRPVWRSHVNIIQLVGYAREPLILAIVTRAVRAGCTCPRGMFSNDSFYSLLGSSDSAGHEPLRAQHPVDPR